MTTLTMPTHAYQVEVKTVWFPDAKGKTRKTREGEEKPVMKRSVIRRLLVEGDVKLGWARLRIVPVTRGGDTRFSFSFVKYQPTRYATTASGKYEELPTALVGDGEWVRQGSEDAEYTTRYLNWHTGGHGADVLHQLLTAEPQ